MGLPSYDSWKLASPPEYDVSDCCPACGVQWEGDAGQCASCGYGEPELYGCDSCDAMLPSDELSHVRNNSVGEGHFCDACLAPAYAAGVKR